MMLAILPKNGLPVAQHRTKPRSTALHAIFDMKLYMPLARQPKIECFCPVLCSLASIFWKRQIIMYLHCKTEQRSCSGASDCIERFLQICIKNKRGFQNERRVYSPKKSFTSRSIDTRKRSCSVLLFMTTL